MKITAFPILFVSVFIYLLLIPHQLLAQNENFYLAENGVTVMCPDALVGESAEVNEVTYTKRSSDQITTDNATTTCTSGITDMSRLFSGSDFNKDIGSWDVSAVTDMTRMFSLSPFNQDISNWDVSSVVNMSWMFYNSDFNQDIGSWDVSSVFDMNTMFTSSSFNRDISNWDVSSVSNMRGMFMNTDYNRDIGNWDVSGVRNMSSMFSGSTFNQDIDNWDVSAVINMSQMFEYSFFNQGISNWDVSSVEFMNGMFVNSQFNQDISNWDVSSVTHMSAIFANSLFNQDISDWDVSKVKVMSHMFYDSDFNQNIGSWDVSSVHDMSLMFAKSSFSYDIKNWDVSAVRNMSEMFASSSFNKEIGKWDVSLVTNMREMFAHSGFNQDISNWDVSNVEHMERMFIDTDFNQYIGDWDVSVVRDMSEMFAHSPFDQDIGNWDVSSVSNMSGMFTETPFNKFIGNWDVSNVENMRGMFKNAQSFNQDIGRWDLKNYLSSFNMQEMFFEASSFNQNLKAWCVFYVFSEPYNFSTGSPLTDNNKPNWGTCPKVPSQIVLNSPTKNQTDVSLKPVLNWEEDSYATSYRLILKESPDSTILDTVVIDTASFAVSDLLKTDTTYLWKVRGIQDFYNVTGEWSPYWSFTTQSRFLSPPQLTSPSDGQENVGTLTEFSWTEVNNANYFHLQISTDDSFNEFVFESSELESTSHTLTEPLDENADYHWRVRSLGNMEENHSEWSDTLAFTTGISTSISGDEQPVSLTLSQNYPNPFNPATQIRYGLPDASKVILEVYNIAGRQVAMLHNGSQSAGWHEVNFDASKLSSGIYIYRLQTESSVEVKKMILLK